jgi:hypothetical protein
MKHAETTLAYVAGLLDGEGCILISRHKKQRASGKVGLEYFFQVGITNTDKPIIDWLKTTFGGNVSNHSSSSKNKGKPGWQWRLSSKHARPFLVSILPHLRIKQKQAALAIEFQNVLIAKGQGIHYVAGDMAIRESYRQKMMVLNHRGGPNTQLVIVGMEA